MNETKPLNSYQPSDFFSGPAGRPAPPPGSRHPGRTMRFEEKKESNPVNPKDFVGSNKVPITTVPVQVLMKLGADIWRLPHALSELGLGMCEGALKYGRSNYRAVGVRASVYVDAYFRHLVLGFVAGEHIDPDSGLHHLSKNSASLTVLADGILQENYVDDRPPRAKQTPKPSYGDGESVYDLTLGIWTEILTWWEGGDDGLIFTALHRSLSLRQDLATNKLVANAQIPNTWAHYNADARRLKEKYPDPVLPFTEKKLYY